jgi:LysM repeat protein
MSSRQSVSQSSPASGQLALQTFTTGLVDSLRALLGSGGHGYSRMGGSKRAVLATCVAVLLIASAATTSFASQYRYEVQSGDTIESIADDFGVNPDAIRASSYLPNGDSLTAGQVIIIPEQGQGPTDAAQMAAQNEGSSPWAYTAHWVEYGENPATIAAMYGVGVDELMEFNGIDDPLDLTVGMRLIIPATSTSSGSSNGSSASSSSSAVTVPVPNHKQQRNLSCEYAATYAAAMAFGWAPTEDVFIASVPNTLNPHYGYRGNIDGWWGNTEDYGIYAEPLVPVLNDWGFHGEVMYTFGDTGPLIEHIDAGHPVVTWLGFWGDTRERMTDDGNYSVFAGMHVVTVYGYDDEGVWVMDPAKGEKVHYSWDFFIQLWEVVDGMSLAVYPY